MSKFFHLRLLSSLSLLKAQEYIIHSTNIKELVGNREEYDGEDKHGESQCKNESSFFSLPISKVDPLD